MKIALLGYGKMGRAIEDIAQRRGHEIVARKTSTTPFEAADLADVAIEFSTPEAAVTNLEWAIDQRIPVVCGTTGWLHDYEKMVDRCHKADAALLYASNFSLGVNLFFEVTQYVAQLMNNRPEYHVSIDEIHHTQKKDAPSGTAITMAEIVASQTDDIDGWVLGKPQAGKIPIRALREPEVPGTHTLFYRSAIDSMSFTHTAHSREGFALGAVLAAEWMAGKKGVFSMKDVLGLHREK
ncbi:MAG: 4-hydroxy-tetrahydrodipicolinate reductase [Flavobacterium sp. BFFFF2]|nr:MAG: 4-hydroxy-tetrahydrodipicolinate reductase [Flavobacterium sp. BFFFF2]